MFQQTLQQYQQLPLEVRTKLSSPETMGVIAGLENIYKQKLALLVMRIAAGEIKIQNLARHLREELRMDAGGAKKLADELVKNVLQPSGVSTQDAKRSHHSQPQRPQVERPLSTVEPAGVVSSSLSTPQTLDTQEKDGVRRLESEKVIASLTTAKKTDNLFGEGLEQEEQEELEQIKKQKSSLASEIVRNDRGEKLSVSSERQDNRIRAVAPLSTAAAESGTTASDNTVPADVVLEAMIVEVGVDLGDEERKKKIINILKSAFKGIRDRIATRDALVRPAEQGGAGVSEGAAVHLIRLMNQQQKRDFSTALGMIKTEGQKSKNKVTTKNKKEEEQHIASALLHKKRAEKKEEKVYARSVFSPPEIAPPPPAIPHNMEHGTWNRQDKTDTVAHKEQQEQVQDSVQEFREKTGHLLEAGGIHQKHAKGFFSSTSGVLPSSPSNNSSSTPDVLPKKPQEITAKENQIFPQAPFVERFSGAQNQGGKSVLDAVKNAPTPKLTGPIDELRTLTLEDFRRMHTDPRSAIKKIEQKIDVLEDDAFEKRIEGIQAFRQSPLFAAYVGLGHQGLLEKKSVDDLMSDRSGDNKLTQAEFEAIMDLNQSLRF